MRIIALDISLSLFPSIQFLHTMSQTQLTINKTSAIQEEEREIQQMDQEIQIMKEKVVKMKALNGLELELATLALLRQQYRSVRLKTEKKVKDGVSICSKDCSMIFMALPDVDE